MIEEILPVNCHGLERQNQNQMEKAQGVVGH